MLTPIEIEDKEFKKALRGFKEDEVNEFLDIVKEDYEQLYRENAELKERVNLYKDQLNSYEDIEETLKATLITAQSAAEDTCSTANKKAKVIVESANLEARQIIEQANRQVIEIRREYDELVKEFKVFRNKFKSLIEDEMRSIDEIFYNVDHNEVSGFETIVYDLDKDKEVAATID